MSSTVNLLVGFRVNSSNEKIRSDRVIRSNYFCQSVTDLNLMYFRYFLDYQIYKP